LTTTLAQHEAAEPYGRVLFLVAAVGSAFLAADRLVRNSDFVDRLNTVKVRDDAPLELLGPLGCGIQTGAGTVLRALKVGEGASFAVTGVHVDRTEWSAGRYFGSDARRWSDDALRRVRAELGVR
jgi:hypothetical protein